jgi:hypothetical protein
MQNFSNFILPNLGWWQNENLRHVYKRQVVIFSLFRRIQFQGFKNAVMRPKNKNKNKKVSKPPSFMLISNLLKMFQKVTKKIINKKVMEK